MTFDIMKKSSFVLIQRVPGLRFSVAAVDCIKDIALDDQETLSAFLYDQVCAIDLEALAILDANSRSIASLWFNEIQNPEGEAISAVLSPPSGGAQQYLCGNLVISGPGDSSGNLTFLHPSRAFAFADALNASERIMLGPNAFMQINSLPLERDLVWRNRRAS